MLSKGMVVRKATHEDIIEAVDELKETLDLHVIKTSEKLYSIEKDSAEKRSELREIRADGQYIKERFSTVEQRLAVLLDHHEKQKTTSAQFPTVIATVITSAVAVLVTGFVGFGLFVLEQQSELKERMIEQVRPR